MNLDIIEEYLQNNKKKFLNEAKNEHENLFRTEEIKNLGANIIERGARDILKEMDVDVKGIEEKNKELRKQLQDKAKKIDKKMSIMPEEQREIRKQLIRNMHHVHFRGLKINPPDDIYIDTDSTCTPNRDCICEGSSNLRTARIYPRIFLRGHGWSGTRSASVICEYVWSCTDTTTGPGYIGANTWLHGRHTQTAEHHCYCHGDDTGYRFEVRMRHSQPSLGIYMPYQTVSTRSPFHHGRIDDFVTYNYNSGIDLIADHEIVVHVRFIIQAWAQSECRTIGINFGDPPGDNYIEMPFVGVYRI